jgi:hypothetical protein
MLQHPLMGASQQADAHGRQFRQGVYEMLSVAANTSKIGMEGRHPLIVN